jgi:hypothetical protein
MHINIHIAIGLISTSILNYFFNFTLLEYLLIFFLAFLCDLDILFYRFTKNNNHRLFITHSIIPSIILIIIGGIIGIYFNYYVLLLGGLSYLLHIIIDTFDWGTNVFYFPKKQVGFKLLISKEELENLPYYFSQYKHPQSFFDSKYYKNKVIIIIEIILFLCMVITVLLYAFEYFLLIILYFIGLWFHLSRHYHLKKIEKS